MRKRRDLHTRDLFAVPEPVAVGFSDDVIGRGSLESKIARVIKTVLDDAREFDGLSRERIAELMTEKLGRAVSKATLDKYAAESADNRIPLDAFIALIGATGDYQALGFIPGMFGHAVVAEKYVELIEIQQIEDHEAIMAERKAVLKARARARR